ALGLAEFLPERLLEAGPVARRRPRIAELAPFAGSRSRVNTDLARRGLTHRLGETVGDLAYDLELGLAVEDADRADLPLGHMAQPADQRDQPFRVGIGLAAHRHAEPGHLTLGPVVATLAGRVLVAVAECRPRRRLLD